MHTLVLTFALMAGLVMLNVSNVYADTNTTPSITATASATPKPTATVAAKANPTATPTATLTPAVTMTTETKVECTTGAYGQQTCKTVVIPKEIKHEPVKAGIAQNVMLAVAGLFVVSSAGYLYSNPRFRKDVK